MAITRYNPNTVWLGGPQPTFVNDLACSEAITPGHLIDSFNSAGVQRWRKHATASIAVAKTVALEQAMMNKGVDDAYATGDLVEAAILAPGATAWMFVASGQTIVHGNKLESAGDGTLKIFSAGVVLFKALENKTAVALTRIRVEAV